MADPDTSPPEGAEAPDEQDGEFGPGGYLPPRAAKRARKIVLREQMGLHWPVAAVVAGVLIVLITLPLVISFGGAPDAPFVPIGPIGDLPPNAGVRTTVSSTPVLVVRADGGLSVFVDPPEDATYCEASRRIEDGVGRVWTTQGRLVAGDGASLTQGEVIAYDGTVYVNAAGTREPLAPRPGDQEPVC